MSFLNKLLGLSPVKTRDVDVSQQQQLGNEFLNPNSQRNRGMYNTLRNMGIDSAAMQHLGGMRMQAAGQNPFANEQYRSSLSNNVQQTQGAYNQYLQNAYGMGSGLLGQALQGNMSNAAATNAARMQAGQNKYDFMGGLFANAMQALPTFLFPGEGG
jgi:multidrug efflux pump subunit AcrB